MKIIEELNASATTQRRASYLNRNQTGNSILFNIIRGEINMLCYANDAINIAENEDNLIWRLWYTKALV